jgi:hypothetical protein
MGGETEQFPTPSIVAYGSCLELVLDANYVLETIVHWSCRLKSTKRSEANYSKRGCLCSFLSTF